MDETVPTKRPRPEKSLLARALAYLARREHSRLELLRKLTPYAQHAEEIETLLDQLQAQNLLSEQRFAESLARRRGERFGTARVKHELKAHGLNRELTSATVAQLEKTEFERALALWGRKFDTPPADAKERTRQLRFLTQRGFAVSLAMNVLKTVATERAATFGRTDRNDD